MARILLVEDDTEVREVFEQILLDAGHEVDTTATFRAASELLSCRDYNVLVADGRLPDGTGLMLADEARAKAIPALIVTGNADLLRGGVELDFRKHRLLLKPVRAPQLVDAVAAALRTT
jgi:two-component system OmpR family response regulator